MSLTLPRFPAPIPRWAPPHFTAEEKAHRVQPMGQDRRSQTVSTKTVPPPQIVMEGDNARARFADPVTSHEAADSNAARVKESQSYVYALFVFHGPMADHELVQRAQHEQDLYGDKVDGTWSPSRLRTARHELVELDVLEDAGVFRPTPSGRRAKVWRLTA